jgi:hypothetical protein
MNYKIRITEDNQAIVKRIADENGMNPNMFDFMLTKKFYIIKENKFYVGNVGYEENIFLEYPELTTDKFIEMFDKKEKLTYTEASKKEERITNAEIIKSMNNPTEWQPKRGDKVLVWDYSYQEPKERIFLSTDGHEDFPILAVRKSKEGKFKDKIYGYKHMKPLPIEQRKEIDFKSQVIELIENRIAMCIESIDEYKKLNSFSSCEIWRNCKHENQLLLKQIKEL